MAQSMVCTVSIVKTRSRAKRLGCAQKGSQGRTLREVPRVTSLSMKPIVLILMSMTSQTQAAGPKQTEPAQVAYQFFWCLIPRKCFFLAKSSCGLRFWLSALCLLSSQSVLWFLLKAVRVPPGEI